MNDFTVAVPVWIEKLHEQGGPTESDRWRAAALVATLGRNGQAMLAESRKAGETALLFHRVAEAIAIFAFAPDGITIFGEHWEVKLECQT